MSDIKSDYDFEKYFGKKAVFLKKKYRISTNYISYRMTKFRQIVIIMSATPQSMGKVS